jgi:hypothetical protein
LTDPQRNQEFLQKDLARVDRIRFSSWHGWPLMIVDNLNFVGVTAFPAEANTPLFVDSDAVLILSIAVKLLESITGRNTQVSE